MLEALKMSDTKLSDVDSFLGSLPAEHEVPGVRAQLRILWTANVRSNLGDDDDAGNAQSAAGQGAEAARRQAVPTPPVSPPRDAGDGDGN